MYGYSDDHEDYSGGGGAGPVLIAFFILMFIVGKINMFFPGILQAIGTVLEWCCVFLMFVFIVVMYAYVLYLYYMKFCDWRRKKDRS